MLYVKQNKFQVPCSLFLGSIQLYLCCRTFMIFICAGSFSVFVARLLYYCFFYKLIII